MNDSLDDLLDRMDAINADASDEVIAATVADCLLWEKPPYYLLILHDARPSAPREIERWRKIVPNYEPPYPIGPCPLPYDWKYKNCVGIDTRDRNRAHRWIIDAMIAGYGVTRGYSPRGRGGGSGYGSLAETRERQERERHGLSSA
jgi:hypothetical protein